MPRLPLLLVPRAPRQVLSPLLVVKPIRPLPRARARSKVAVLPLQAVATDKPSSEDGADVCSARRENTAGLRSLLRVSCTVP